MTIAAGAVVAVGAVGTAAMGDGRDDSGDKRSHDQRSDEWSESGGSGDWRDSWDRKERKETARATLSGYQEDPKTISTPGSGRFEAQIDERNKEIRYRLSYEDLKDVQQAHIHFGGRHQSGGIIAFLCSNIKDGKGGPSKDVPECPKEEGTVTGTIKPDDIVGPADQGIEPGEFDEVVDAIEAGVTYVNVHTKKYPDGEIRGQVKVDKDRDDKDRDGKDKDRNWDASDSEGWNSDEGEDRGSDKGEHSDKDRKSDKGDDHWDGWVNGEE
ncbi:CHRD domain-containing protein [Micromonospora costi]|uniref:CHRD domain-containing protein n=1 Tax=Micromonospora costi TaxID=1530042 RepID=UPI00131A03B2|nr:CHRD domain-containing protein [Micromonospora costi]